MNIKLPLAGEQSFGLVLSQQLPQPAWFNTDTDSRALKKLRVFPVFLIWSNELRVTDVLFRRHLHCHPEIENLGIL